jgi:hypothetical protein
MINALEYELGREYQKERQREAATYRLACRASADGQCWFTRCVPVRMVVRLCAWVGRLLEPAPRHVKDTFQAMRQTAIRSH